MTSSFFPLLTFHRLFTRATLKTKYSTLISNVLYACWLASQDLSTELYSICYGCHTKSNKMDGLKQETSSFASIGGWKTKIKESAVS